MINGINHITLSVRSLEESFLFYKEVLGFKPLMKKKKSAYFLAGDLWFCIEEDSATRREPMPEYTHIAFTVSDLDFPVIEEQIKESGAKIFKKNISEGNSIYFLDPNGHKLEIHVGDWQSRLAAYREDSETEFFNN
ncbi:MAG: VOC family protein [Bdellovibrionales bacterium]|nr:VOC family protein [Bdellovibrionales bacterium]